MRFPTLQKFIQAAAASLLWATTACGAPAESAATPPEKAGTQAENQPPSQTGELIWRDPSCFFFVLKMGENYALFEFLGGPSPMVGNVFEGKLAAFGTRKIENKTEGKPTMVYSETFDVPKALMDKKIPRQCKRKKEFEAIAG